MSDKDIKEEINDEEQTEAAETAPSSPASELVDLVLSGELHAANEKFNGIVESKVVQSIEDEKLKIAQTLFNEADDEVDEAKKEKEDDDEEEGDDDSKDDSDDDDDDDSDDDDKKGEVPPQFKKEDKKDVKKEEVEEVAPEQSFDPGEATTDAPLPENSFVKQVSDYLAGNRK